MAQSIGAKGYHVESTTEPSAGKAAGYEKRVFSRVECLVDLEVEHEGVKPSRVEAVDLSLLGVGIEFKEPRTPVLPGDDLTVAMRGLRPIKGRVRWTAGSRAGVQFSGKIHDIADSWVGEVLAAQGVKLGDIIRVI